MPDGGPTETFAEPTMATTTEHLWTVARIAEHLNVPRHRVEYLIETRRINPTDRAGQARVFDPLDVYLIASELRRIEADREGVTCEA